MAYDKQTWVPYDPDLSYDQNKANGGAVSADRLNNMETGISNAFDKTSDTIGGRNLLPGTSGPFTMWYGSLNTVWNADKKRAEISLPTTVSPTEVVPKDPSFFLNVTPGIPYTQSIYVSTDAPLTGKAMQVSWFTTTYGHNTNGKDDISSIGKNVYRITSTQTWPASSTDDNIRLFDLFNLGFVFDFAKGTFLYFYQPKIEQGSIATDWTPAPEDKVNVSDMRKPASDVAGIEEVNAKQDKLTITPADDSKVAHLSGANNFDTIPTVNNNPLLLASSLPSDLARTSQQTNFTAGLQSNGQDVLTVKTPGVPKLAVNYNVNSKAFDYTMTAPEKDGFSDIIQYNLLWKDHSVDDWKTVIVKPDDLTGQLTGVDITKTYDFKAAAQNAVGSSDFTDVITLPAASAPGIPSLTVEYDAGKKGFDYTVTAPESDGGSEITEYSLEYQKQGGTDWTKVALKPDSLTGTVTDGVEAGSNYLFRVNAENAVGSSDYFTVSDQLQAIDGNVYGASWDGSSSGALQRTDAAVGLKAGINGAQNEFDTRGPWGLMDKTVTDSYGNAFVRVPKFYIRKTQNKPLSTWQVSLVKQGDDWYLPNCFYDFDNKKELEYVDVSRYEGSIASGKLQSKTGATPTDSQTIVQLRSSAVANNTGDKKGYHLWDVHTLDALQVLFTIEFATLDSQSIMQGNDSNANLINNGAADNVKGSSGFVTSGATPMTYRGIENLYGNLAMFTDGLNANNLSLYSCDDATKYASDVFTSPYYKLNYSLQSMTSGNLNITGLGFDKDHPSVEAPISSNNDQYSTYYHDYGYVSGSGNYVVYTGGGWNWGAGRPGLWCWGGCYSSTDAYSNVGSRLLKKAL